MPHEIHSRAYSHLQATRHFLDQVDIELQPEILALDNVGPNPSIFDRLVNLLKSASSIKEEAFLLRSTIRQTRDRILHAPDPLVEEVERLRAEAADRIESDVFKVGELIYRKNDLSRFVGKVLQAGFLTANGRPYCVVSFPAMDKIIALDEDEIAQVDVTVPGTTVRRVSDGREGKVLNVIPIVGKDSLVAVRFPTDHPTTVDIESVERNDLVRVLLDRTKLGTLSKSLTD